MRLLFSILSVIILVPRLSLAQFTLAPGTYELATGATGTAALQLVLAEGGKPTVLVGVKNKREHRFRTSEVTACSIENHRFIQVTDFRFRSGTDADFKEPTLLESLEVGAVELYYYHYLVDMGPNFKAHVKLPVLRKPGTSVFFAYAPGRTPGFDQKLAPGGFVAALFPADPTLQRQLATNSITRAQLPAVVRAYNQGVRLPR